MATAVQSYNNTAGTNQLSAENATFYQTAMLERLLPELVYMKYGEKKNIPKRHGATAQWRRLNSLEVSTTAVTEGVTPDGVNLDITAITATVQTYGSWTKISDFIDLVGLDPLLTETSELMGENAGESVDTIIRDVIYAGTNVQYANSKANRAAVAATDKITALEILRARRTMKRNKVKQVNIPGRGKGYIAFVHTDVAMDLMQLPEWVKANVENGTKNFEDGIIGKLYGVYFVEVDNGVKYAGEGASSADVYATLFIGRGAYGIPDVEGSSKPEIIVHSAGSAGTADPLNQFNTVAWKCVFATMRINELCLVRLESGASL
ncbi:N4-gp56 family major capsid protein [Fontibacillus solani]|uniref:N4-gp56 family major capsid protein n=1 Tax=Fontibacillus solani TaxID=1572857 RepID=A0A7W3XUD5_9BACL|nr:N4-gp56 family major capsid protein [Fontibacillus solani]MBA9088727.1 N4-gp56 family major capsid protein [Fontibacillus solani]